MQDAVRILLVVVVSFIAAQVIKVIGTSIKKRKFYLKAFAEAGGLPSGHSAMMVALTAMIFFVQGLSVAFSVSLVLSLIIMYDAVGVRGETEKQAITLNKLIKKNKLKIPLLNEEVGHTYLEVVLGAVLGVLVAVLFVI